MLTPVRARLSVEVRPTAYGTGTRVGTAAPKIIHWADRFLWAPERRDRGAAWQDGTDCGGHL